jgi:hypothetical protein
MRAAVAQGVLVSPLLFSLYVNDIPTPSRHVQLTQYADNTAVIATSHSPSLVDSYPEVYLGGLELRLPGWMFDIKVSMNTALLFVKA